MRGFLSKLPVKHKSARFGSKWQRRYFVLCEGTLAYFLSASDTQARSATPC